MAREYLLAHRSYRQLASRLAENGFPVLRFDFYGCGDSNGTSEEGSLGQWLSDISTAINEMRSRSGTRRLCLVGLRLGGTLAIQAGILRRDINSMVLWNPVLNGRLYIDDMRSLHQVIFRHLQGKHMDAASAEQDIGVLGYRLTDTMRADLETIDLYAVQKRPADKILIVQSSEPHAGTQFAQHLTAAGVEVSSQYVPFPPVWTEGIYKSHIPKPVLTVMTDWITAVNS
jgi:alpha-beta hydrolase superfamily lysophospholipase